MLLALSGVLLAPSPSLLTGRRPARGSGCVCSRLSAPWLATVGSCAVLLKLSGVLNAIAVAAVDAPAALCFALHLQPPLCSSARHGVGSCIVLLSLSGLLRAIAAAAVETAAAVRAALPLQLP